MITLNQIKLDILYGRSKCIYYAAQSSWWSHLQKDVDEATLIGREVIKKEHEIFMNREDVKPEEKIRIDNIFQSLSKNNITPMAVDGSPLMMTVNPYHFIDEAERVPTFFGRHGIKAFLKAHHQNCDNKAFTGWEAYNKILDAEKEPNRNDPCPCGSGKKYKNCCLNQIKNSIIIH